MKILNKDTKDFVELNLCHEYDVDQTKEVVGGDDNISWNEETGNWEADAETIAWWQNVEKYNIEWAELLSCSGISRGEFDEWIEHKGYWISQDLDLAEKEKVEYLKEMMAEMDKHYMNIATGNVDTYDGWWYENENGEKVNAVDLGEVVEVVKNADGDWVET
ncbi:MAG: hypothetical protein J6S91_04030 [Treponema sp.]|nr:hypothetical protein [Treponema sp.]